MNWRNPFLTGYLAVTVVGAGILGYLVYSSSARYTEVSETYDAQVLKLHQLQNRKPFPNEENYQTFKKFTEEYRSEYDRLLATLAKTQRPLESITPQAFQDRLRDYVSAVTTAAKANDVKLGNTPDGGASDFYLGFEQYRDSLPPNEAAPLLARELDAVRSVVDRLIEFRVSQITTIKRDLLPEEPGFRRAEPTPPPGARPPRPGVGNAPANAPAASSAVASSAFNIVFVGDQNQLRQALNSIVTSDRFLLIRALNIQNERLDGPPQVDPNAAAAAPALDPNASPDATPAPAAPTMRLLVGREKLTAAVRIEVVKFTPPDATAAAR